MSDPSQDDPTISASQIVFEKLHHEILALHLTPFSKITEAEVADRFGVSRQPVRDAFGRLNSLGMLTVRPQRPTVVRGFSMEEITDARFVRLSVELEIIRRACVKPDAQHMTSLDSNLELQRRSIKEERIDAFHGLDYDFHRLICKLGGHPMAFETIKRCKQKVDRLCLLSLDRTEEVVSVLEDHQNIVGAIREGSARRATRLLRRHASRLDGAIQNIHKSHGHFFEK